eukprot:augustus_masked-scaffold_48-processed-gene-0.48-mRNA-1 protein AED:1.00 eAED:1.00 QI:0/-1/0/0/-1/1/1/0/399
MDDNVFNSSIPLFLDKRQTSNEVRDIETGHVREAIAECIIRPFSGINGLYGNSTYYGVDESLPKIDPEPIHGLHSFHVKRVAKNKFWLFDENTKKFCLSAYFCLETRCFYISQYEQFPHFPESYSHCFILKYDSSNKVHLLQSSFCQNCDNNLGLYTCGEFSFNEEKQRTKERQILAMIKHKTTGVETREVVIDCNSCEVSLPPLSLIWCPRSLGAKGVAGLLNSISQITNFDLTCQPQHEAEESLNSENVRTDNGYRAFSSSIPSSVKKRVLIEPWERKLCSPFIKKSVNSLINNDDVGCDISREEITCMLSKKPRYDPATNSLRMKFENNRIQIPSSKNMIFTHINKDTNAEICLLQFGKCNENRFSLDFKAPLSIIQGFGISLSLFQWRGPQHRKR